MRVKERRSGAIESEVGYPSFDVICRVGADSRPVMASVWLPLSR